MKKLPILIACLTLILSACTAGTIQDSMPTNTTSAATPAPAQTTEPTAMTGAEATQEPAPAETASQSQGVAQTGVVTYQLVPEESSITYEVDETFINENNRLNTAIGTTAGVSGEFQADFDNPQNSSLGPLTVDISGLTSDSGRRDNAIRDRFLQSSQFPTVTFTATSITGLPATYEQGVDYPVTITGDLTIREVTFPATFDTTIRLDSDTVRGKAETTFLMSDFGFGPISILGMLNTVDEVHIIVDFVARPKS